MQRIAAAEEGSDAAMAELTGHGESEAADATEIHAHTGSRAVEAGIGSGQVGDEVAGPGRAGDEAAAVHLAAVLEVTDELGEAVEVERAAEGVHEILLTRAVDGVAQAEFDRTTRDIRVAAPILSVAQEQFAGAHLGERRASDDLAGEVDRGAGGHLEEAGVGSRGRAQLDARHRERVGDGAGTGGASEEEVTGGEAERGERGAGDVARGRIGHSERVQGRTHRGEVVTRRGGGDLGGGSRHQGGVGEGGGRGVVREGDDVGAGGRRGGEALVRSRGGRVGAEDERGAVRDRSDGRARGDVRADDTHAGDEAGGAGHGHVGIGVGRRAGEKLDRAGVAREIIARQADAALDALHVVRMGGSGHEPDDVGRTEATDRRKIEDRGGIGEGDRRERKEVGSGAGHGDTARAFADRQGASRFGRAGAVSDQAEQSVVLKGDEASGNTTTTDVTRGVIEGEFALIADEDTEAADGTHG